MYCGPNCSTVPPQLLKQHIWGSTLQFLSNHPHHTFGRCCLATNWSSVHTISLVETQSRCLRMSPPPISLTLAGGVCTVFSQHSPSPQVWMAQRCACVHFMLHPAARPGHQNNTCTDTECTRSSVNIYVPRSSHHQYSGTHQLHDILQLLYTHSQFVV